MRYRRFVEVKCGFFVWIWEERSSRFIKESSVKRTGQLALCSVDSDSAQVCALPDSPLSSLSTWYGKLWFGFRIRTWKGHAAVCLFILFPFNTVFCSWRVSEAVLFISPFSALLSPSPFLIFSFLYSYSCFLSGPLLTYISFEFIYTAFYLLF